MPHYAEHPFYMESPSNSPGFVLGFFVAMHEGELYGAHSSERLHRPLYSAVSLTGSHGQEVAGWFEGPRRLQANAWQSYGEEHEVLRSREDLKPRADVGLQLVLCAGTKLCLGLQRILILSRSVDRGRALHNAPPFF